MGVLLLVRHAQASFGAEDYDVLSDLGHEQARLLGARLARLPRVDRVVHGTMRRQEHTAQLATEELGARPVATDARLDEYDHEDLLLVAHPGEEDRRAAAERIAAAPDPRRAFQDRFDEALARWTDGGDEGAYRESYRSFRSRVADAVDDLAASSGTTVVVSSGGVIAAAVADELGLDAAGWARLNRVIVNTGLTKVVVGRRGRTLVTVNDHAHLETAPPHLLTYR